MMAQKDPVILVAGLGRCGLTAMMGLLHAGGVPCAGPPLVFEPPQMQLPAPNRDWVRAQAGRAVKWVDPTSARMAPGFPAKCIHMTRDPKNQARSMAKLAFGCASDVTRADVRRMAAANRQDTARTLAMLRAFGPVCRITFESLVSDPDAIAGVVKSFLADDVSLNAEAGARIILRRPPDCALDLSMEMKLSKMSAALEGAP